MSAGRRTKRCGKSGECRHKAWHPAPGASVSMSAETYLSAVLCEQNPLSPCPLSTVSARLGAARHSNAGLEINNKSRTTFPCNHGNDQAQHFPDEQCQHSICRQLIQSPGNVSASFGDQIILPPPSQNLTSIPAGTLQLRPEPSQSAALAFAPGEVTKDVVLCERLEIQKERGLAVTKTKVLHKRTVSWLFSPLGTCEKGQTSTWGVPKPREVCPNSSPTAVGDLREEEGPRGGGGGPAANSIWTTLTTLASRTPSRTAR